MAFHQHPWHPMAIPTLQLHLGVRDMVQTESSRSTVKSFRLVLKRSKHESLVMFFLDSGCSCWVFRAVTGIPWHPIHTLLHVAVLHPGESEVPKEGSDL